MRKPLIAAMIAVTALPAVATPALARPHRAHWTPAQDYRDRHGNIRYHRTDNGVRYWRGQDGRYYCKRGNGTVGLLAGGVLGALLGRTIDTRGDRATGTVLGAAAGAVVGNEVARGQGRCR